MRLIVWIYARLPAPERDIDPRELLLASCSELDHGWLRKQHQLDELHMWVRDGLPAPPGVVGVSHASRARQPVARIVGEYGPISQRVDRRGSIAPRVILELRDLALGVGDGSD